MFCLNYKFCKLTEIFCIIDEFDQKFEHEMKKNLLPVVDVKKHRNRKASLSDIEIMTVLLFSISGLTVISSTITSAVSMGI